MCVTVLNFFKETIFAQFNKCQQALFIYICLVSSIQNRVGVTIAYMFFLLLLFALCFHIEHFLSAFHVYMLELVFLSNFSKKR